MTTQTRTRAGEGGETRGTGETGGTPPADLTDEQRNFAAASLAEFGDSWKRPVDFADGATPTGVESERSVKLITREQRATESRGTVSVPPSSYASYERDRVPFDDRLASAEESFLDETVEYVSSPSSVDTCHGCTGAGDVTCSRCNGGQHSCTNCGGDGVERCTACAGLANKGGRGRISCPDCHASGTRTSNGSDRTCATCAGSGHVMCNNCSGQGEHRCTTCGGGGIVTCSTCGGTTRVTCSTCEGETELVTATVGSIEFAADESTAVVSELGVPEAYVAGAHGERHRVDHDWRGLSTLDEEVVLRTEIERRHVDSSVIEYEYGGEDYRLYDVEERLRAESYPRSKSRAVVPYFVGTGLVLAFAALAFVYLL